MPSAFFSQTSRPTRALRTLLHLPPTPDLLDSADGVGLCDGNYLEELRRHPAFSFLFQQRGGLCTSTVAEAGHGHSAAPNLQTLSTAEPYLEAVKATTPRAAEPRR